MEPQEGHGCPPVTCWEDIGHFEKEEGDGCVSRLLGRRGSPGCIYKHLALNQFEATESVLPEGFHEKPFAYNSWARMYVWNPAKRRVIPRTPPHPSAVGEVFFPNENGGREFAVFVQPLIDGGRIEDGVAVVSVLRVPRDCFVHRDDDHRDCSLSWQLPSPSWYQELVCSFERPERVWISHDFVEGQHGCSILVHVDTERYVLICGMHIVEFVSTERVIQSFSNLGNNDVPYPVALTASRALFLLDMVWVPRAVFAGLNLHRDEDWAGAYEQHFYALGLDGGRAEIGDVASDLPRALPLDGVRQLAAVTTFSEE